MTHLSFETKRLIFFQSSLQIVVICEKIHKAIKNVKYQEKNRMKEKTQGKMSRNTLKRLSLGEPYHESTGRQYENNRNRITYSHF